MTLKLLLIFLLIISSCSKSSNGGKEKKTDETIIEGTVVKIFNLIIPSAHATDFAVLLSGNSNKDKCRDSDRCVVLLDINNNIIDMAPLIDNKFKFVFNYSLNLDSYKLIVFNKEYIISRQIVLTKEELKNLSNQIEINPESTLLSDYKESLIKDRKSLSLIDSFLDRLMGLFNQINLRQLALDIIENIQLKDYFRNLDDVEYISLIKKENEFYEQFPNISIEEKANRVCELISEMKEKEESILFNNLTEFDIAQLTRLNSELDESNAQYQNLIASDLSGSQVSSLSFVEKNMELEQLIQQVFVLEARKRNICNSNKSAIDLRVRRNEMILMMEQYFVENNHSWECEDKLLKKDDFLCGTTDHL